MLEHVRAEEIAIRERPDRRREREREDQRGSGEEREA
jgi:hypothetical protein